MPEKPRVRHVGDDCNGQPLYSFVARQVAPDDPGARQSYSIWPTRNDSGIRVSHDTALKYSAVWACVNYLARTLAYLPWNVFRRRDGGGRDRAASHPVDWLLHTQPNPEMSAFSFRQALMGHALTWGNGYAEIERDRAGRVMALWPITPDRASPDRDNSGALVYEIDGRGTVLAASDVYHIRGLGFDGLVGYSVITMAAQAIGMGLAAEQFGASFFGNGAHLGGVLEHPGKITDASLKHVRESFQSTYGGAAKAGKVGILEEGMKYTRIGIPPNDAQFLESRMHQVTDICRWFGVPPHKVADLEKATFSNIEHQSIEVVQDSIAPWARVMELEADIKLFGQNRGANFTRMNLNSLMRGDSQSRAEFYRVMFNIGAYSPNDILELEDRNPVDGGDIRMVPLNMATLEHANRTGNTSRNQSEPVIQVNDIMDEMRDVKKNGKNGRIAFRDQ